jgi:hypothetical protein
MPEDFAASVRTTLLAAREHAALLRNLTEPADRWRLSRLAPALTAQERGILILEAWKNDMPEDPAWRKHMPQDQTPAFNRYIELMNQANTVLGRVISVLHMQTAPIGNTRLVSDDGHEYRLPRDDE